MRQYDASVKVFPCTNRAMIVFRVHGERAEELVKLGQARPVGSGRRIRAIELVIERGIFEDDRRRPSTSGYHADSYVGSFDEPIFRAPQLECMGVIVRPAFDGDEPVCVGVRR